MADADDEPLDPGDAPARPSPIEGIPGWWGPIANESEYQLSAAEFDVFEFADLIGFVDADEEQLRTFASASPSRHRYLICEHLSTTRWAWVYVALDLFTERPVVLKISAREVEPEGRTITRLSHPNVVTVHDMFVHAGYPTMVLEWCTHGNLRLYALAAPDWQTVIGRGLEAGRGLAYCHEQGVIHGDIKPDNILITQDVGRIADFGLARGVTIDGQVGGTLGFMPPEREQGVWSTAGDVYSFAMTLTCVLKIYKDVPEAVGVLLTAAMDEDPEQRPALSTLIAELELLVEETHRRQEHGLEPPDLGRRRRRGFQWQIAAVAAWAVIITSTVVLAGVCSLPSTVEMREPSIERAIELAEAGDTLGAWFEYHQIVEHASQPPSATDLLTFSKVLLDAAQRSADPTTPAILAEITAMRAHKIYVQHGNGVRTRDAALLRDAAHDIIHRLHN